jgi:hypothetical protein
MRQPRRQRRLRPPAAACAGALLVVAGSSLAGCYHHVIRADGPGEQNVEIYQPNVSAKPSAIEQIESAVWDQPAASSRNRGNTRSKRD